MPPQGSVTELLQAWNRGDAEALEHLAPLVQVELRDMARRILARERAGHGLQPTELVHESYLRLLGSRMAQWNDRAHFFATVARMMRRRIVDAVRQRQTQKRGGGAEVVSLDGRDVAAPAIDPDLVALERALDGLAVESPRAAQLVELRFFGGCTMEEAAETLGVSLRTASYDWNTARAWLHRELTREAPV
jgi:RNA polymerase sigma-70 factor, ECF subfamily